MNKLYIENDKIKQCQLDTTLQIALDEKNKLFSVNSIKIHVIKDTELWIDYHADEEIKLDVFIKVEPHVHLSLYEVRTGKRIKIQYKFYLEEYANVDVHKFYCTDKVREVDIVHLNGTGSKINFLLKTIAVNDEKYDMMVYHNAKKTESNIVNHGVTLKDGSIIFNITSSVPNGKKGCIVKEQNRIITTNNEKCKISPNLLIDEFDVEASHSALIGKFQDEELFYLQSRGIKKDDAISLLTKGFLCSYITNEDMLNKIGDGINRYWR